LRTRRKKVEEVVTVVVAEGQMMMCCCCCCCSLEEALMSPMNPATELLSLLEEEVDEALMPTYPFG
jgi:hypothetical protein